MATTEIFVTPACSIVIDLGILEQALWPGDLEYFSSSSNFDINLSIFVRPSKNYIKECFLCSSDHCVLNLAYLLPLAYSCAATQWHWPAFTLQWLCHTFDTQLRWNVFFCSIDSCGCQTLHSNCPRHILRACTETLWPWPTSHAPLTLT